MKQLLFILLIIPFFVKGQTIYSGQYNKYNYKWTLKINNDSTIALVRSGKIYDEYKGTIKRINDTTFKIKASLIFCQTKCRAIGDSLFYVTTDSAILITNPVIKINYSNNETINYSITDKDKTTISINKKLFNSNPGKTYFQVSIGHINPITEKEVITKYDIKDEYCMTIYTENEISFYVKIKNNTLKSEGKNQVDKLFLRK